MFLNLSFLIIIFSCCIAYVIPGSADEGDEHKEFPPEGYMKTESGKHDEPVYVDFTVWIESVIRIDSSAMEMIVNSYIIQEWQDKRLKRDNHHVIMLQEAKDLWTPDVYCLNCRKSALDDPSSRVLLRIDEEGNIYFSRPGLLNAACNFEFQNFPFDVQTCKMQFSSYSNNNSFVQYELKNATFLDQHDLEQFKISTEIKKNVRVATYLSGNYTIIELELTFFRQVGFYLIRLYIPTSILVCLCMIAFYVSPSDIETRLTIGITLILSMIFLLGYSDSSLPKVSYIKAIDWFLIVSLVMIVLSVMETVGIYWYICRKENQEKARRSLMLSQLSENLHNRKEGESSDEEHEVANGNKRGNGKAARNRKYSMKMNLLSLADDNRCDRRFSTVSITNQFTNHHLVEEEIDDFRTRVAQFEVGARIIFPLVFTIFSILYSVHYTNHS